MRIILATRNPSKALEIQDLFAAQRHIKILTLDDVGIQGEAPEEGDSLEANALEKAVFAHTRAPEPMWVISDDSGIFINALGGEPGVQSAHWGGKGITTEARTAYCLEQLRGVSDRSATFRVVVAVISPQGTRRFFSGELQGDLLEASQVPSRPKMPYSTLFVPRGHTQCLAAMSIPAENAISHRGQAFRQVLEYLLVQ